MEAEDFPKPPSPPPLFRDTVFFADRPLKAALKIHSHAHVAASRDCRPGLTDLILLMDTSGALIEHLM